MFKRQKVEPTGITLFGFGITWKISKSEYAIIQEKVGRLMAGLQDKRVLWVPTEAESPEHVLASVDAIRGELTFALQSLGNKSEAAPLLSAMLNRCHDLVNYLAPVLQELSDHNSTKRMMFDLRLGGFRDVFLVYVAILSRVFSAPVHGELEKVLPPI